MTRDSRARYGGGMKLAELAQRSGVSTASIKHYQREGVLARPRLLNQTTGVYDERHLDRLELIRFARERLALPLARIRTLVVLIEAEEVPVFVLMGACQQLAIDGQFPTWLASELPSPLDAAPFEARTGRPDAAGAAGPAPTTEVWSPGREPHLEAARAMARETCAAIGWTMPDEGGLDPLVSALATAAADGEEVHLDYLVALGRALEGLARENVVSTREAGSRDGIALGVLRGVALQNRLLLAMDAVAHAAASG